MRTSMLARFYADEVERAASQRPFAPSSARDFVASVVVFIGFVYGLKSNVVCVRPC